MSPTPKGVAAPAAANEDAENDILDRALYEAREMGDRYGWRDYIMWLDRMLALNGVRA